jgi:hypothetical protein
MSLDFILVAAAGQGDCRERRAGSGELQGARYARRRLGRCEACAARVW